MDGVPGGLVPHAVQLGDVLHGEGVEVRRVVDQAGVHHLLQHRRAHAVDIHGLPGGEVAEVPQKLRRAFRPGAAGGGLPGLPVDRGAADGANGGQMVGHGPFRPLLWQDLYHFRNDLPGLADQDGVPHPDVLLRDEILVVEGGVGDGGARQPHRGEDGLRRQDTGAAHLDHDVLHHGLLLLRRVLKGDGPAGHFGRGAQDLTV